MQMKLILCALIFTSYSYAQEISVTDEKGQTLKNVQISKKLSNPPALDNSDGGYPKDNLAFYAEPEISVWTNKQGKARFSTKTEGFDLNIRKFGYKPVTLSLSLKDKKVVVKLKKENDPIVLAASKPANMWLGALDLGNHLDKKVFQVQCGFCHQQGTEFIRGDRSEKEWKEIISRMVGYGSRLPSDLQNKFPRLLVEGYKKLNDNPELLAHFDDENLDLSQYQVREWPISDIMGQTHDMLFAQNKLVYVADNIQDRLYEVDPKTNFITIYKIPHLAGEKNGGLIAARLKEFPRHDSTSNAHSLAESKVDGHIFITPSAQKRLVEFDPKSKKFILHEMKKGFYPHTIRIDAKDRVWFTLALSNQVAMFDRKTKEFTYYDLPTRSFKEKLIVNNIELMFKIMNLGIPLSKWLPIKRDYDGTPLVYGIDITPDDKVWVARLHTDEIGVIDADSKTIKMYKTPFMGPRRLRTDELGRLWIVAFGDSGIASFDPKTEQFKFFDLPVKPKGSETPYALNVDKIRKKVWVTGNQSDSLYGFDWQKNSWEVVRLPRRTSFTRDIEFSDDGTIYTANSNFPSWHIEGQQPTLIEVSKKK